MPRVTKEQDIEFTWEENGYPAAPKLLSILKRESLHKFTLKEVQEYIAKQAVSQLHAKRRTKSKSSHITTTAPAVMYCIDLLDMTAYARDNGGVKWLLLCIDIFTRVAMIVPTKNKTAADVAVALQQAFDEFGVYPKVVLSDKGSEFKGATAKFLKQNDVIQRLAEVGDHRRLGIVDRFSGVVKGWIAKYMTQKQSKRYIDVLPKFVEKYNDAPHSSLGEMTPNEAWLHPGRTRDIHYETIMGAMRKSGKKRSLRVGDWVRVAKLKGVFDKGYNVNFSLTAHQVVEIKGLNYVLDNGKFYRAARLLKIPAPEESPGRDVGKEARRERKRDLILQAEGIDPDHVPLRRSARERKPESMVSDVRYGKVNWG